MFEKLLHEAALLQPVSRTACDAFRRETQNLLHFVNNALTHHPHIDELSGNCYKPMPETSFQSFFPYGNAQSINFCRQPKQTK